MKNLIVRIAHRLTGCPITKCRVQLFRNKDNHDRQRYPFQVSQTCVCGVEYFAKLPISQ